MLLIIFHLMLSFLGGYLHAKKSKKSTNYFWRYRWSMNSAIWLDESILVCNLWTRIVQDMGLYRKTENCDDFHFRLLPAKSIDRILRNSKNLCPFMSVIYVHFIGNKNFWGKFAPVTFLISIMLFFQDRDGKV